MKATAASLATSPSGVASTRCLDRNNRLGVAACCIALSVALSACGSTVAPSATTAPNAGDGLSAPQLDGVPGQASDGLDLDGVPAAVPGSQTDSAAPGGVNSAAGVGSSGSAGAPTAGGSGDVNPGPGAVASGSAPTGPLKVGVLNVGSSTGAVGAIGAEAQTTVNEQNLTRAFVKALNADGGVAGRKLEVVEYTQDPNSNNYATDMEAACARFTQDNKVNLVLRAQLGGVMSENYNNCLAKAGATSLEMSFAVGDNSYLKRYPGLYNISAPSVDRRMQGVLTGLNQSGYLSSKNKIGILVEDCPESQNAFKNTVAPLAKSLGLSIQTRNVGCLRGFGDVGSFSAQVQSAVLPFHSDGVDRVAFVSGWEVLMLLFFETGASNQGWRPQYALSSNSPVGGSSGQFSDEQLSRMRGMGWAPHNDTRTPAPNATAKKCDAMAKSQGISAQTEGDAGLLRAVCDLFLFFKAAVEAGGRRDDAASLAAGMASAARTYQSPSMLGGRLELGHGRQDAATQVAEFGFVDNCKCFRYLGAPRPLPR